MKFTNYLKNIDSVQLYPIISLVIFLIVFILVLIYVFSVNKKELDDQAQIPLK